MQTEDSACLLIAADCDGRIVSLNSVCEQVTGYQADELIGKPLIELLVPPVWRDLVRQRFTDTATFDVRNPHCKPWITKDGKQRMIEWSCNFVVCEKGPMVVGRGRLCDDHTEIRWANVRMITFGDNSVTLFLKGEDAPRVVAFNNRAEMEEQIRRWFSTGR